MNQPEFIQGLSPTKLIIVAAVTAVALAIWGAESQVKPLDGDAVCFVPVAVNLAAGHGWINEFYHPAEVADQTHPEKYTWHGVVAPKLWSLLSPTPDFEGARIAGVIWSAIGLLCFGLVLARQRTLPAWMLMLAMIGSAWLFTHNGRPEPIAAVIVAATLLCLPREVNTRWHLVAGAGLGLVGATAPAAAALVAPWIVIAIGCSKGTWKSVFAGTVIVGLVSIAVVLALVSATGCTPGVWFESMMLHSKNVLWNRTDGGFVFYWVVNPERPFLIGVTALLVFCAWRVVADFIPSATWVRLGIALSLLFFSLVAYRVAVRPTPCLYNLFPLFVVLTVVAASVRARPLVVLFACAMLPAILGLARSAAMSRSATTSGLSRQRAMGALADDLRALKAKDLKVSLSSALFELSDLPDLVTRRPSINYGRAGAEVYVQQQAKMGALYPPMVSGFHLVTDRFDHTKVALSALGLAKTSGSYAYAIYLRDGVGAQ